jgi:spermidine synthase
MHKKCSFLCAALLTLLVLESAAPAARPGRTPLGSGRLELEVRSEYSHVRVRRRGSVYSLNFVRDNGVEVVETVMDLRRPRVLLVPYTQVMFASYLFQPNPKRVCIVGLGGGSMARFLRHHEPELAIDAVEIDPVVVKIAAEQFGTRPDEKLTITTADGLAYLDETENRYGAIYMDAFLKPSAETDATGLPRRLKTERFYRDLKGKLSPGGVVAVNLNLHADVADDLRTLRAAFAQTYVFRVSRNNVIVVASPAEERVPLSTLRTRAGELDRRFRANFSFTAMLGFLAP